MSHYTPLPAHEEAIGGDGNLYRGEDKTLQWAIYDEPGGVRVDVAGWTCVLVVKTREKATAETITKTATIVGTYNADESLNTQYVQVVLTDDDMDIDAPFVYRYSLKRTDAGHEDILRAGTFTVELATQT